MENISELKKTFLKYYPYFFFPLIVIYLFFNIFDANNGLFAHPRLDSQIATLEKSIKDIKTDNALYEVKISSLNNSDSNSDLIDEQIRNVLGYGKSQEFIIFFDN